MGTAKTSGVVMASVPVLRPAAARGQVCGGSVSSVLRTVAASPEQSTSLAMVPGTGGHTASDLATPLPVLVMGA